MAALVFLGFANLDIIDTVTKHTHSSKQTHQTSTHRRHTAATAPGHRTTATHQHSTRRRRSGEYMCNTYFVIQPSSVWLVMFDVSCVFCVRVAVAVAVAAVRVV